MAQGSLRLRSYYGFAKYALETAARNIHSSKTKSTLQDTYRFLQHKLLTFPKNKESLVSCSHFYKICTSAFPATRLTSSSQKEIDHS